MASKNYTLILLLLLWSLGARAHSSGTEKPLDTLKYSLGMNIMSYNRVLFNPNLDLSYRVQPHIAYRAGIGFARLPVNDILNASNTRISGAYGSLGIGLYALSWNRKQYESWMLAVDGVYSSMVHRAEVNIPYAYGTYHGYFREPLHAYGVRITLARYIRILWATNRLNLDMGVEIGYFHIRHSLPSETYIPGGGYASQDENLPKAITIFPKLAVHYRFNTN